ncbi:hypothetical protein SH611_05420 [Geminicoccaceae bacterium 1502E]|nr:hypothetical protein [Geminicoccaceae bacterium 1502E]
MSRGRLSTAELVAALEGRLVAAQICSRCGVVGLAERRRVSGLQRVHRKERPDAPRSLAEGDTVWQSARSCAVSMALCWRHRFLQAIRTNAAHLTGIVEPPGTRVPESRADSRAWWRTPGLVGRKPPVWWQREPTRPVAGAGPGRRRSLRRHRGIATRYPASCLQRFHLAVLGPRATAPDLPRCRHGSAVKRAAHERREPSLPYSRRTGSA